MAILAVREHVVGRPNMEGGGRQDLYAETVVLVRLDGVPFGDLRRVTA